MEEQPCSEEVKEHQGSASMKRHLTATIAVAATGDVDPEVPVASYVLEAEHGAMPRRS